MTDEEIQKAKESFLRMGVAEKSIFSRLEIKKFAMVLSEFVKLS